MEKIKIKNKPTLLTIAKGVLVSVCASLIAILLFAVILRFVDMSDGTIKAINQIIKVLSVFLGAYTALKKEPTYGYIKGIIIGAVYTLLSFLIFSLLDSNISFSVTIIFDLLFAVVIGAVCGIICANIKK